MKPIDEPDELKETDFYTSEELASLLDVKIGWLNHNRSSDEPIPYKKFGRLVRYKKSEVLKWIGRKDLDLKYFSTKTLAEKLSLSTSWLKHNRSSENPLPFRRFGYLVRYNNTEVMRWVKKNWPGNET